MSDRILQNPGGPLPRVTPGTIVIFFALVMTACVLGVVAWKALQAKSTALESGRTDIQNLAHSLAEHASHTIQAADIAMTGMVDLLKYQAPLPERFNKYLAETVATLPQIREMGVLDADGEWRYSSLVQTPRYNNSDRNYFVYHRDTPGKVLRISEPLQSRLTGRPTILLSKRIKQAGRQFRRRTVRGNRQRLFQRLLQRIPDWLGRQHQPVPQRRHRSDPLADFGPHQGPVEDGSVLEEPPIEFRRILQDPLAVRRHREIFRIRGNAAISDGRHRGDVRGLAAFRLVDDAAHGCPRGRRAAVHDHLAGHAYSRLSSDFA